MATYVTKKCPHCGYAYQFMQGGDQRKYGCPYKICERCNNPYWDTDIKEPALYGYENLHETMESVSQGCTLFIYIPFVIIALFGGIYLLLNAEIIGIFLLALGGINAYIICSYLKRKKDEITNRDEIIKTQQKEYDESMKRLQDINYLSRLAKVDSLAKKLLEERKNGELEHYAKRPQ